MWRLRRNPPQAVGGAGAANGGRAGCPLFLRGGAKARRGPGIDKSGCGPDIGRIICVYLKDGVGYPDNLNFCLRKLELDDRDRVVSLAADYATYKEAMLSTHILEYELYRLYRKVSGKGGSFSPSLEYLWKHMPVRRAMHGGVVVTGESARMKYGLRDLLLNSRGRISNLGTQLLILYKRSDGQYATFLCKRAQKGIANCQNYYQFIPSGGFETGLGVDDDVPQETIRERYDLPFAVFKEYLEEIFGEDECIDTDAYKIYERIFGGGGNAAGDARIRYIEERLANRRCKMKFLGVTYGMASFGIELSFALLFDRTDFWEEQFGGDVRNIKGNYESVRTVEKAERTGIVLDSRAYIANLAGTLKNTKTPLYDGSAGLLHLAMNDEDFRDVLRPVSERSKSLRTGDRTPSCAPGAPNGTPPAGPDGEGDGCPACRP